MLNRVAQLGQRLARRPRTRFRYLVARHPVLARSGLADAVKKGFAGVASVGVSEETIPRVPHGAQEPTIKPREPEQDIRRPHDPLKDGQHRPKPNFVGQTDLRLAGEVMIALHASCHDTPIPRTMPTISQTAVQLGGKLHGQELGGSWGALSE